LSSNKEFKFLVINTHELWKKYENKDKSQSVEIDLEGIRLESTTTYVYESNITSLIPHHPIDFVLDWCDILYILDGITRKIQRVFLKGVGEYEWIEEKIFDDPKALEVDQNYIYVLDRDVVQVIDKISYQTKQVINVGWNARYLATDKHGHLFVFDARERQIYKVWLDDTTEKTPLLNDSGKAHIPSEGTRRKVLAMTIGPRHDKIYILTTQSIEIFNSKGRFEKGINLRFEAFKPSGIAVDNYGNIFVGNVGRGEFVSPIKIDHVTGNISSLEYYGRSDRLFFSRVTLHDYHLYIINLARKDKQYLTKDNRIDLMKKFKKFASIGTYASRPLDSQTTGLLWHKFVLHSKIPNNTSIEFSYYTSDNAADNPSDPSWVTVGFDPDTNPKDALIDTSGQYLWFKLTLFSKDDMGTTPTVSSVRAYFPRLSYLRYLPAVYQADLTSKAFLERFLSIFETFFSEIEEKIFSFSKYIDARTTPDNFLPWLASWLGLGVDQRWSKEYIRRFIEEAPDLYKKRGTRDGLEKILLTYLNTDKSNIMIFEQFQFDYLTKATRDLYSRLYFRGNNAYAFCVLLNSSTVDEKKLEIVKSIVENEKPAHTVGYIDVFGPWFYLGIHSFLGINTMLANGVKRQDFIVGVSAIGRDSSMGTFERYETGG
jgi:phage tail-like protein